MKLLDKQDYLLLILIAFILTVAALAQSETIWWVFYAIVSLILVFKTKIYGFMCLSFLVSFYGILTIPGIGRVALAFLVTLFIFVQFIKNYKKPLGNVNYIDLMFILLGISIILSSLNSEIYSSSNLAYPILILLLILLRQIIPKSPILIRKILIFYVAGLILSGCLGLYLNRYASVYNSYIRVFGCMGDPNYFSRALLFGVSYVLLILRTPLNKKWTITLTIITVVLSLEIILTYSRMGLVVLLILLIMSSFYFSRKLKVGIIFLFVICILFLLLRTQILAPYFGRFQMLYYGVNSFTAGRFEIQKYLLQVWSRSNILIQVFGSGLGSSLRITQQSSYIPIPNVAHSIYVQILVEQGLLGLFSLLSLIYVLFKASLKHGTLLSFITYIVCGLLLSGLFYWDQFMFYLIDDKYSMKRTPIGFRLPNNILANTASINKNGKLPYYRKTLWKQLKRGKETNGIS